MSGTLMVLGLDVQRDTSEDIMSSSVHCICIAMSLGCGHLSYTHAQGVN